eukprot:GHVR01078069.1.p3 GENE.GHVR01078069.1~~GHVR01078069.1.p3  ORF type:complete len:123 (+),score=16.16 GHVR01078069.1:696-1064(+)
MMQRQSETGETNSVCVFHVDDILMTSIDVIPDLDNIGNKLKATTPECLEQGQVFKFIGLEYSRIEEGIYIGQQQYLSGLILKDRGSNKGNKVTDKDMRKPEEGEVEARLQKKILSHERSTRI